MLSVARRRACKQATLPRLNGDVAGWRDGVRRQELHSPSTTSLSEFQPVANESSLPGIKKLKGVPFPAPKGHWSSLDARREFCDKLFAELGLPNKEDWYSVPATTWLEYGGVPKGHRILKIYGGSPYNTLTSLYPDHTWLPWRFSALPRGAWANKQTQRDFMMWLVEELKLSGIKELINVSVQLFREHGASALLNGYNSSVTAMVRDIFPEVDWESNRESTAKSKPHFPKVPPNFFQSVDNQRVYMEWAGANLGVSELKDWYGISKSKFNTLGEVRWLKNQYDGLYTALKAIYPEHEWQPWLFSTSPKGFWTKLDNQKQFMADLMKRLDITEAALEKWYRVDTETIRKSGGASLLKQYGNSPVRMLAALFPQHQWVAWKFGGSPGALSTREAQKQFCEWMMQDMGMTDMTDWYRISSRDFETRGGAGLLARFSGSVTSVLVKIFTQHTWHIWRFDNIPRGYWTAIRDKADVATLSDYIRFVETTNHIRSEADWYRVSVSSLEAPHIRTFLPTFGGILPVLKLVYPDYPWDAEKMSKQQKKSVQRLLLSVLLQIFPGDEIIEETTQGDSLPSSLKKFHFDMYVPAKRLIVEYDGEQHYRDVSHPGQRDRATGGDTEKLAACQRENITLISVPYWWDGELVSLANTIRSQRDDIVPTSIPAGAPIPREP